jgi:hypothetical protein
MYSSTNLQVVTMGLESLCSKQVIIKFPLISKWSFEYLLSGNLPSEYLLGGRLLYEYLLSNRLPCEYLLNIRASCE